ncbi:MAG: hypothetical protein KGL39_51335 [Patescibacteria group bacterium]|nr:hypothetical protein [Patescibacteria group bacterium]
MSEQTKPKLCVDCKHAIAREAGITSAFMLCGKSAIAELEPLSLVLGRESAIKEIGVIHNYCRTERGSTAKEYCGPEGKWWEPKV